MGLADGSERVWEMIEPDEFAEGLDLVASPIPTLRLGDGLPSNVVPLRPGIGWKRAAEDAAISDAVPRAARRRVSMPEWPMALVGLGVLLALVLSVIGEPRSGCFVLAAATGGAAVLRVALGDAGSGLLRSRSRTADLIVLGTLAVGMFAVALGMPTPG